MLERNLKPLDLTQRVCFLAHREKGPILILALLAVNTHEVLHHTQSSFILANLGSTCVNLVRGLVN